MHINVSQALTHQAIFLDNMHHFFMLSRARLGEGIEKRKNSRPVLEISAG